ncbi:MAG: penicillin amidase, partial [Saprospiraceae bacterium]
MFKKIVIAIGVLIIIAGVGGYVYLRSTAPTYNGEISISGIKSDVEIKFDNFGIPHIYAQNDEDCYKALGYVHAQDRLFQM